MKLSPVHIDRAVTQFDAQPMPEDHPAMPEFSRVFGEHTFFFDQHGLAILEPSEPPEEGMTTGRVVKLARWTNDARRVLAPHEREETGIVVVLAKAA